MIPFSKMTQPTPRKSVSRWSLVSILGLVGLFVTTKFDLIKTLGLSQETQNYIYFFGSLLAFLFTVKTFNTTPDDEAGKRNNRN